MSLELRNERDDLRLRVKELEYQVETLTKDRDSWKNSFGRLNRVFKTTSDKTIDQDMQLADALRINSALRECLEAYPQWPDECPHGEEVDLCLPCETDYLRNVQRWKVVRDAALTQPAEVPSPLTNMSPQLRNVLYDLIRRLPPQADQGDQQALEEFIAEVKP